MKPQVDLNKTHELVEWLRDCTLDNVVEKVYSKLDEGIDEDLLWATGAITACHYINNQAHNMLGFVSHALIGCEDARRLAAQQPEHIRHMLLAQCLWQVVFDMNDPCMSPYQLLPSKGLREETVAENIKMLRMDVRIGEYMRCDHRFVTLEQDMPREDLIDLLFDLGLYGMTTDDHTFITPLLSLGMCELVGWEAGFDMLRCALRYNASFPRDFAPHDRAVTLRTDHGLDNGASNQTFEPDQIEKLRQAFHQAEPYERPEVAAKAMSEDNYSPETVLAAVSLAGCDMYLCTDPVPHEDFDAVSREVAPIHIGTCVSALRASMKHLSPATQVLVAIRGASQLERGPSVLSEEFEFIPYVASREYPYQEDVEALENQTSNSLLVTLREALMAHDHRTATASVRAYELAGYDAEDLITVLTEIACTDNHTILHNFKHLNSMVKEFHMSQHADRWRYLIASARWIAWYAGVDTDVYDRCNAIAGEPV